MDPSEYAKSAGSAHGAGSQAALPHLKANAAEVESVHRPARNSRVGCDRVCLSLPQIRSGSRLDLNRATFRPMADELEPMWFICGQIYASDEHKPGNLISFELNLGCVTPLAASCAI